MSLSINQSINQSCQFGDMPFGIKLQNNVEKMYIVSIVTYACTCQNCNLSILKCNVKMANHSALIDRFTLPEEILIAYDNTSYKSLSLFCCHNR